MAMNYARTIIRRSSNCAKTLLSRTQSSPAVSPKRSGLATSRRLFSTSRLPAEIVSVESLMSLHSVTASALLTSMLSSSKVGGRWGFLSEALKLCLGNLIYEIVMDSTKNTCGEEVEKTEVNGEEVRVVDKSREVDDDKTFVSKSLRGSEARKKMNRRLVSRLSKDGLG